MAVELHIERDRPIRLDEWKAALSETVGASLVCEDCVTTNPKTGDAITIRARDGNAMIAIPGRSAPLHLRWFGGTESFRLPDEWDDPNAAVRSVLGKLAGLLKARIVNDDGEDCTPGQRNSWWKLW